MSTRAMYTFKDQNDTIHVYKHSDGYPTGAADAINAALPFAWPLPRFEADEFAAAFVCGNKIPHWSRDTFASALTTLAVSPRPEGFDDTKVNVEFNVPRYAFGPAPIGQGGGVRLMPSGSIKKVAPSDIEYRYEITQDTNGGLRVKAFTVDNWDSYSECMILNCRLDEFVGKAKELENQNKTA